MAVLNVGSPACGVNATIRSIIRYGLCEGHNMFAIFDGFEGLINNQVQKMFLFLTKKNHNFMNARLKVSIGCQLMVGVVLVVHYLVVKSR